MFGNRPPVFSLYLHVFIFFNTCLLACKQKADLPESPAFSETPEAHAIHPLSIQEASGMADSKVNPGHLWVLEDSGNKPVLFLLKADGTVVKSLFVKWAWNYDWEDLALCTGPEPGKNYLYIADIGDNSRHRIEYSIFRFEEPLAKEDTVFQPDRIAFVFPDGHHNSEAMLVDPATKDIFIITKTDSRSGIYKLTYPYSTTRLNNVEKVGELPYNFATGAAISPDGKDIVVKTYGDIFYYPHNTGESLAQSLRKTSVNLPYQAEPQGEAISFAVNNSGYYTISEKALSSMVKLYYYKRK
jgi:hypothetical protein